MLVLLSYALGICALTGLVGCVALGLLKICDLIEERPNTARSIARNSTWAVAIISTIITFTDDLSYFFLLVSWASNYAALCTLQPKSWLFSTSPLLLSISIIAPVLVHMNLVYHFRHSKPEPGPQIDRKPWPGGRQDWDTLKPLGMQERSYGSGEALTCFALCWWPALWIALGAITQNWTLPMAKSRLREQTSR